MGFSNQEYWSGLPFPSSGDFPDPGIEPRSPIMEKNLKKNIYIYIYIKLNDFPVHQKLMQHYKKNRTLILPLENTSQKKNIKNLCIFTHFQMNRDTYDPHADQVCTVS